MSAMSLNLTVIDTFTFCSLGDAAANLVCTALPLPFSVILFSESFPLSRKVPSHHYKEREGK
jgi:hypothetical protein